MPKILIWTSYSDKNKDVARFTASNHFEYAFKHGYSITRHFCPYEALTEIYGHISDLLKEYDTIFMLDADTLIKKKSVKLEDIAAMGQDVILCEETLGPKFKINMGAMILNKTDNTFKFLKDLHDSRVYWAKYHFISQEFVNDNLESMPITVVPETTFNTILYPDFSKYSPNDFIVHFAANENRIQVIKDFVKQYGY